MKNTSLMVLCFIARFLITASVIFFLDWTIFPVVRTEYGGMINRLNSPKSQMSLNCFWQPLCTALKRYIKLQSKNRYFNRCLISKYINFFYILDKAIPLAPTTSQIYDSRSISTSLLTHLTLRIKWQISCNPMMQKFSPSLPTFLWMTTWSSPNVRCLDFAFFDICYYSKIFFMSYHALISSYIF